MITLTSDFGTPYPAAMKGVILQTCETRIIDIGHEFPRQDVTSGAFWLREILPEFPPAVHLVVIDPGVGTDRNALVIQAGAHYLVGPDNGVLIPAARELVGEAEFNVFEITVDSARSSTFHGRDIFAPVAAVVHETIPRPLQSLAELSSIDEYVDLTFPEANITESEIVGDVLAIDSFGNVITNIPGSHLRGESVAAINGRSVPVVQSYAHEPPGTPLITIGSHGNVECAVNQGRGDDAFNLGVGDQVVLDIYDPQ